MNIQLKRVFDVDLEEVLLQEQAAIGDNLLVPPPAAPDGGRSTAPEMRLVPRILVALADSVRTEGGFAAEGIFRISAEADKVKQLRGVLDVGGYNRIAQLCKGDPYLPAAVLKLWLRSLKVALVPPAHYERAIEGCEDPARCRAVVDALPRPNAAVIWCVWGGGTGFFCFFCFVLFLFRFCLCFGFGFRSCPFCFDYSRSKHSQFTFPSLQHPMQVPRRLHCRGRAAQRPHAHDRRAARQALCAEHRAAAGPCADRRRLAQGHRVHPLPHQGGGGHPKLTQV
jgi:hypothetical protein